MASGLGRRAFCEISLFGPLGLVFACADPTSTPAAADARRSPAERRARDTPPPSASPGAASAARDAFTFDPELFERKVPPRAGDWLERFPEQHQSFSAYANSDPVRPTPKRRKIVIQPLGAFDPKQKRMLGTMSEHASLFFALPVELAEALPLPLDGRRQRSEGGRRWTQHRVDVILDETLGRRVPDDAIAYLGITFGDLYPEPSWNFVFGQATLDERIGVYSLARFMPEFTGERPRDAAKRVLRRSLHILSHETGHMFGITHCIEYECLMNGSNSLDELDRQRGTLCPTCLHKLAHAVGFDVRARFAALRDFYRRQGLDDLAAWKERRLARL